MKVPLLDLKAQYAAIGPEIMSAVQAVMESQVFALGPAVDRLEGLVAKRCGCKAAVGVSSGTDALLCSLMALEIGSGSEVITTPYTFFGTAGSIWRAGARPVFVDIEPDTFSIDPAKIASAITKNTRAIIPVHLFGQMAEMEPIMKLAQRHDLHVIEDAAQSFGAAQNGRKAGSIGIVGCLSFYPTKNLGGIGDGGMIVTQDAALADRLSALRNHGQCGHYTHKWVGGNFRLDNLQAAALIVKLDHLADWTRRRRDHAGRYGELLADCPAVATPTIRPHNVSVVNQYVIRAARRDALRSFLQAEGIGTGVYYPLSLHQQECFAALGYKQGDFPVSEAAAAETLALPVYAELSDEQIGYVADKIKEFCS